MSRIDDLSQELCPEGVEFRELRDVARIRNGKDYRTFNPGDVPVYGSGGVMATIDTAAHDGPSVLIPRKGSLDKVYYVDRPFWTGDTIFYTEIDQNVTVPKFFFYLLQSMRLAELNQAGGVPSLTQTMLNRLRIPVPPLKVQREVVRVLDLFQSLEAELEARRRQYEHYRDALLTFTEMDRRVRWLTLGEVARNLDSKRKPVAKAARVAGPYPYYGASGAVDHVNDYLFDGDFLLVSEDGANLLARSTPIAFSVSGKVWVNNHAHVLEFEEYATRRVVEVYLNSIDLSMYVSSAAQPKLNQQNLNRIPVPIPPREEQVRIVGILDKFDALVNDISIGLPAELTARRKQYEHYRDRLLTFPERAA